MRNGGRAYRKWTPEEKEKLWSLVEEGRGLKEICEALGRGPGSVSTMKTEISGRRWTWAPRPPGPTNHKKPKSPVRSKRRICLRCDRPFRSKGNRLCPYCNKSNQNVHDFGSAMESPL